MLLYSMGVFGLQERIGSQGRPCVGAHSAGHVEKGRTRRGGMVSIPSTERIVYRIIAYVLNPQPETPEIESTQLA